MHVFAGKSDDRACRRRPADVRDQRAGGQGTVWLVARLVSRARTRAAVREARGVAAGERPGHARRLSSRPVHCRCRDRTQSQYRLETRRQRNFTPGSSLPSSSGPCASLGPSPHRRRLPPSSAVLVRRRVPLLSDNCCCSRHRPQPPESRSTSASFRTALVSACLRVDSVRLRSSGVAHFPLKWLGSRWLSFALHPAAAPRRSPALPPPSQAPRRTPPSRLFPTSFRLNAHDARTRLRRSRRYPQHHRDFARAV